MKLIYSKAERAAMIKALIKKLRVIFFLSDIDQDLPQGIVYH
jgi:hypothetical protein